MFRYLCAMLIILVAGMWIILAPVMAADRFIDNGDGTVTDQIRAISTGYRLRSG